MMPATIQRTFAAGNRRSVLFWRVLVYLIAFLAMAVLWSWLRSELRQAGMPSLVVELAAGGFYVAAALGVTATVRRWIDRRA